jgi:dUTP pyrophosphatase
MQIELKYLRESRYPLKYATPGAAGVDLHADLERSITIRPGATFRIPTGIAIHIWNRELVGKVYPRSGLGCKGLVLANGTGVIDSDYQGELFVVACNRNFHESLFVDPGDRVAQLLFEYVAHPEFKIVEEFATKSKRGEGCLGSTGVGAFAEALIV